MARIECRSVQRGVPSVYIDVDGLSDGQLARFREQLNRDLSGAAQVSDVVADALVELSALAPAANPSDLWHHVIYRHLLNEGWSDARWKRVSGFALERALVRVYQPRLAPYDVRMRLVGKAEAVELLERLGVDDAGHTKLDIFFEGLRAGTWGVFGAGHVKSSIAERIQDDVPASLAFMRRGLMSVLLTMDVKSYPPPHGQCVNYGELGARTFKEDSQKARIKRAYIEDAGQFDALFSYNMRTPPSVGATASGKRIYTLPLQSVQPDSLVSYVVERWKSHPNVIDV